MDYETYLTILACLLLPFITPALLAETNGTQRQDPFQLSCWDQTFAYNTVRIEEREGFYEVGLKGADIGPLQFETYPSNISIRAWDYGKALFHRFPVEDCRLENNTLACQSVSQPNHRDLKLFVEHSVQDLGVVSEIISPAPAKTLDFILSDSLRLDIKGARYSNTEDDVQSIIFERLFCGVHAPGDFDVHFSDRLRNYLNQRP